MAASAHLTHRHFSWPGLALGLLCASPLLAQTHAEQEREEPPTAEGVVTLPADALEEMPASAQDDHVILPPVIVTATKREADLRSLPMSIHAFSGDELEEMGAQSLRDLVDRVPGLGQTEISSSYNRLAVRGMQTDAAAVTPAATGYFIDDVPLSDPFLLHPRPDLPPFDLAGIEILKGPQGTLFGGSALAGALRYKLNDAQPGVFESKGFYQWRDQTDGQPHQIGGAALNLPLGDDGGLRLVGVRRLVGGRIDDLRNDNPDTDKGTQNSARALLRWDASADWSLGLKVFHEASYYRDAPVAETTNGELTRERALRNSPYESGTDFLALDVTWRLPLMELVSVTSLLDKQGNLSGRYLERGLGIEDLGQPADAPVTEDIQGLVQELRLTSSENSESVWQWLIGVYAHDYDEYSTQRLLTTESISGLEISLLDFEGDIQARELALFGELARDLGSRWRVTLGLRGYQIQTAGETLSRGAIILATGSPENRNDADIKASGLNPRLALQWHVNSALSSYASIARGFRFGGIQIIGPSPVAPNAKQTYDPDSIWSYELGLRSTWLEQRLQLDAAAFFIDWEKPQVQTTLDGPVPLNTIDNAGHARSYGGELAIRYQPPLTGLFASLAAAYTDAHITEPYTAPSGDEVAAGSRLPGSSEYEIVAALDYQWRWGLQRWALNLTHKILGPGVNDILQNMPINDYASTDLRLSWSQATWPGQPRLSASLRNLADERAVTYASVVNEDNFTTNYNNTRSFDLRIDMSF